MAPARERLDCDEEVGGAMPLVFIMAPLDLTGSWRQAGTDIGVQHDGLCVEADGGVALVASYSDANARQVRPVILLPSLPCCSSGESHQQGAR